VNSLVPWGTAIPVRSGTRSTCFRGPKSLEIFRSSTACRARNFPNQLNLTCCSEPAGCEQVDWRDQSSRFQCPTITPIPRYGFVFGDTRMHASVRVSTRSSSTSRSNGHRYTKLLHKSRRGELANPDPFGFPAADCAYCASGDRHQRSARHGRNSGLISWAAGRNNASLTVYVSARHSSHERAAA
jgi:hypothetical protein